MFGKMLTIFKAAMALTLLGFGLAAWAQCGGGGCCECDRCDICGTGGGILCPACDEYFECLYMCPLIVDLEGDGFKFSGPEGAVEFDMFVTGTPQKAQWVLPNQDDAFLAMDLNGNGIVDDGSEMFGNGTLMLMDGTRAMNGFVGLAQYDRLEYGGNDDGLITEADRIWQDLYLWLDSDADGVSQPFEMAPIGEFRVSGFNVIPREKYHYDKNDNWLRFFGNAHFIEESRDKPSSQSLNNGRLLDVYFLKVKQDYTPRVPEPNRDPIQTKTEK